MRVDYLRYFSHLAEVLNYTRAAEDLYIAQPTLSVAIKRMENELGMRLFRRGEGERKVELTEVGEVLYEHISQALNSIDTGLRIAHELQGQQDSHLRIGTIYAMQGKLWSQAMQAFSATQREKPKISIEQAYSPALIDRVRRGSLDACFAARVEGDSDLNHVLVWSQPLVLGVHKDNPLAKRKSVSVKDLLKLDIMTYAFTSPASKSLDASLPTAEMQLDRNYDDEITLCALVASNPQNSALFCYSFLVSAFNDVVCIPIVGIPADFHKVYLNSRRESHPKVVEDFIAFMTQYRFPNVYDVQ